MALLILCSCAVVAPASQPVMVDETLTGSRISMDGARAIAKLRIRERGEFEQRLLEEKRRGDIADAQAKAATKMAADNVWWATNAPWVVGITALIAAGLGFTGGVLVAK